MMMTAPRGCLAVHHLVVAALALASGSLFSLPVFAFSSSTTPSPSSSSSTTTTMTSKEEDPITTTRSSKVTFRGLDPSAIRHPLDRQLTDLTNQIAFFPFGPVAQDTVRNLYNVVEQVVRLDLLSTSVKVSKTQLPHLYKSLDEVCQILDLQVGDGDDDGHATTIKPDLFVQSSPQANAYTLAIQSSSSTSSFPSSSSSSFSSSSSSKTRSSSRKSSSRPIIVVTSALVDRCTPEEIQAVIGHECGHIKCEHSLWLTLGNVITSGLPGFVLPKILLPRRQDQRTNTNNLMSEWRLAAEYTCDRAALLVAQDPTVVNSAMLKLTSGTSQTTNVGAFMEQSREYDDLLNGDGDDGGGDDDDDDEKNNQVDKFVRSTIRRLVSSSQQRTHPLPIKRVVELDKWSQSQDYQRLVKLGTRQDYYN